MRPVQNQTPALSEQELRIQVAMEHDKRIRELERQHVSIWSEAAELAMLVRDNREWEILQYRSFNDWLSSAAPQSRAYIYAGIGLMTALTDIDRDDLRAIPQSTARVMKSLPSKLRNDPEILGQAKTMAPREFVQEIQKRKPELHIEIKVPRKFRFETSQEKVIDAAILMANILEAGCEDQKVMSDEESLESICAEWMESRRAECEEIVNSHD